MTAIRAYLPATAADVAELVENGETSPRQRMAYAVSPALVAATPRADRDEREYLAFLEAVAAAAVGAGGLRRVIIAADLTPEVVVWPAQGSGCDVTLALAKRDVVAFHVDEVALPVAEDEAAGAGDLLWFDATEAGSVLDLLGSPSAPE